jgi:hypothetical protein
MIQCSLCENCDTFVKLNQCQHVFCFQCIDDCTQSQTETNITIELKCPCCNTSYNHYIENEQVKMIQFKITEENNILKEIDRKLTRRERDEIVKSWCIFNQIPHIMSNPHNKSDQELVKLFQIEKHDVDPKERQQWKLNHSHNLIKTDVDVFYQDHWCAGTIEYLSKQINTNQLVMVYAWSKLPNFYPMIQLPINSCLLAPRYSKLEPPRMDNHDIDCDNHVSYNNDDDSDCLSFFNRFDK